jgi:hypothetical protein
MGAGQGRSHGLSDVFTRNTQGAAGHNIKALKKSGDLEKVRKVSKVLKNH